MDGFLKSVITCLAAMLLLGCTEPPSYSAALDGISSQDESTIPIAAKLSVTPSIGLILSDNVDKSIVYNNEDRKTTGQFPLPNTMAIADQDPRYLNDRIVALLREVFPTVELVNNLPEAAAKGMPQTVVLDMRVKVGQHSGDRSTASLSLIFFNQQGVAYSRVEGTGSAVVPYPAFTSRFQVAADEALAKLRANLTKAS